MYSRTVGPTAIYVLNFLTASLTLTFRTTRYFNTVHLLEITIHSLQVRNSQQSLLMMHGVLQWFLRHAGTTASSSTAVSVSRACWRAGSLWTCAAVDSSGAAACPETRYTPVSRNRMWVPLRMPVSSNFTLTIIMVLILYLSRLMKLAVYCLSQRLPVRIYKQNYVYTATNIVSYKIV
jgi:hypothetical protein